MDIHFCGNELKSFSLFGDAEACEMMQPKQEKKSELSCCEGPKKEIKSCQNEKALKGAFYFLVLKVLEHLKFQEY